jgi:hypothetical protein
MVPVLALETAHLPLMDMLQIADLDVFDPFFLPLFLVHLQGLHMLK